MIDEKALQTLIYGQIPIDIPGADADAIAKNIVKAIRPYLAAAAPPAADVELVSKLDSLKAGSFTDNNAINRCIAIVRTHHSEQEEIIRVMREALLNTHAFVSGNISRLPGESPHKILTQIEAALAFCDKVVQGSEISDNKRESDNQIEGEKS